MEINLKEQEQLDALLNLFRNDIALFARIMFDIELTQKQIEFAVKFRDSRQITFRGGVGFGKTLVMSVTVWWALITHDEVQVTIFGPNEGQLKGGIWKELTSLYGKMDALFAQSFDVTATRISRKTRGSDCFAEFRLANKDNIASTRGIHKTNNFVFVDEATGIDEEIFTGSLINILTDPNPKLCLVSNPDKIDSYFYRTFYDPLISDDWVKVHGAMIDGRNATPELVEQMAGQYGGKTTNKYRSLVLGEFPISDVDGLIPRDLVEMAVANKSVVPAHTMPIIWGVDPAGAGGDRSVLIKRHDNKVTEHPKEWRRLDPVQLAYKIHDEYTEAKRNGVAPLHICVDAIGIGHGVAAALRDFGLPVKNVVVSQSPTRKPDLYSRLRDQLWWECKEWFETQNVSIPDHADLIKELCTPTYQEFPKIKIEDKNSIRKRLHVSPDYADALCLTFAVSSSRFASKWNWNKPLDPGDLRWAE